MFQSQPLVDIEVCSTACRPLLNPCGGTSGLKERVEGKREQTGLKRHGGQAPQFLQACSSRFARKKIKVGWILHVYMMSLNKAKTDWVRFAFILEELGELPSSEISYIFNSIWRNRSRSSSSVAQLMYAHQSKGFEMIDELTFGHEHIKIWHFYGELPQIPRGTILRWKNKLTPFRG